MARPQDQRTITGLDKRKGGVHRKTSTAQVSKETPEIRAGSGRQ